MDNDAAMYIKNGDYNSACEIADEYYEQFKLDESEEILNEMYDKLIDEYGTGSEEAIRCLKKIALVNREKHNFDYALSLYNTVLEWYDQNDMLYESNALDTMAEIATIFNHYNRYDEAYALLGKAYDISSETYGKNDSESCHILFEIADCCEELGQYEESILCYEQLIEIYESDDNDDCAEPLALAYNGLSYTYRKMGQLEKAKELCEKAVEIMKENGAQDSTNLLLILNELCGIYSRLEMYDKEFSLRKDVLKRAEELYGFEHYNVNIAKSNLADAYESLGDYKKAAELFKECYDWSVTNLGENHGETVRNLNRLARALRKTGKYDEAICLIEKVYIHLSETLGENHPDTIDAMESLAFCYADKKEYGIAKEMLRKTIELSRSKYRSCARYFYLCESYIFMCALNGDYAETIELVGKLEQFSKTFSEPVENGLDEFMAIAYKGLDRFDKAAFYQRKSIEFYKGVRPKDHPEILQAELELADILFEKEEYPEALKICLSLSEKLEKSCQREQDRLNNTVLTARIYTATGKHSQAGALLDTLLESTDKEQYKDIYADALFASAENNKLLKQYATALKQAEQSLEIRRKVYKSTSSKIVDSVNQCNEINKLIKKEKQNETM